MFHFFQNYVLLYMKFLSNGDNIYANQSNYIYLCRFAHPITYGDYPESMRSIVGDRLPKFTKEESKLLKGSYDFLGVNYYTSTYVQSAPANNINKSYTADIQATLSGKCNTILYLPKAHIHI